METYLVHHGILGQRWGIRRYQNPDGTLTAEGKRRQRVQDKQYREKALKKVDKYYNKNYHYGPYGLRKQLGIETLNKKIAEEQDASAKRDMKIALKYKERLRDLERQKVNSLKHKGIAREQKIAGEAYIKAVGATVAASVALPGVSWIIFPPTPQKQLSDNRISKKEREEILNEVKPKNYKGKIQTSKDVK